MTRPLDVDTQTAIRNRNAIVPRNFIVITCKDRSTGSPSLRCFWDDAETVTVNVLDETGVEVSHNFTGDGAVQSIDPIPMRIGLDVQTVQLVLSAVHAEVKNAILGDDPRDAKVEIYRGLLDPQSMLLVATPRIRFLGKINVAPETVAGPGGESTFELGVVSHSRELTRTNPARKSDEQQKLRGGDRFRRYITTAGDWPIVWGEAKS